MTPEGIKRMLIAHGWGPSERRQIAEFMRHLDEEPEAQRLASEFDLVRALLVAPAGDAEPEGGWESYEERLRQQLALRLRPRGLTRILQIGAIAASVLAALGAGWWVRGMLGQAQASAELERFAFTPEQLEQHAALFDDFARRAEGLPAWLLSGQGLAGIGPRATPTGKADDGRLLVLRMIFGDEQHVLSQADVAVVPGEKAEVLVPVGGDRKIRYALSTSASDLTQLSVRMEVEDKRDPMAASLETDVKLRPGQLLEAGRVQTSDGPVKLRLLATEVQRPVADRR